MHCISFHQRPFPFRIGDDTKLMKDFIKEKPQSAIVIDDIE